MRVISGTAKGRTLKSPGEATRPITDRVKENLFNILGSHVVDASVLDLFAGAGNVGIEALSRGARHATFVELDREALRAIYQNLELTKLIERAKVAKIDVFKFIRHASPPHPNPPPSAAGEEAYDLIYVAPPQYKELWAETLKTLDGRGLLSDDGIVVVQIHPKEYHELELNEFVMYDQRKYGSTMLCFYKKSDKAT
jgi:16S rRNA (guanine(966)-N(2))-methyltransferase RsmD